MNNDIVTRLRGLACPECGLPSTHNHFDEAANEIERLRKIIVDFKVATEWEMCDPNDPCKMCEESQ